MHPHTLRFRTTCAATVALALAIGACSNNDDNISPNNRFLLTKITADVSGDGVSVDPNLVNPWGIAFGPTGVLWAADNGTGLSTTYNGSGVPQSTIVTIPSAGAGAGAPTGIVLNTTANFLIGGTGPAAFLFAGEDGTISAWNGGGSATIVVNRSAQGSVFKGIAIGSSNGHNFLFATDFHNGQVVMWDSTFAFVKTFTDATIPAGFAPFGIANINGQLFVTYAKQLAPDNVDDDAGNGNGFVDIFNTDGSFVKRFAANGTLNSPWAVVMAPATFGSFGGEILVGNFGNGQISAFNATTGAFDDFMRDHEANVLEIPGLWGLAFGTGAAATTLYSASGPNDEQHGFLSTITGPVGP
jgi:uncharacterized protein (TIGR03118 family)